MLMTTYFLERSNKLVKITHHFNVPCHYFNVFFITKSGNMLHITPTPL